MNKFFYTMVFFWLVQQVNDVVNAFLNRRNVPKLYWLSAAASFVSGSMLFVYLASVTGVLEIIVGVLAQLGLL